MNWLQIIAQYIAAGNITGRIPQVDNNIPEFYAVFVNLINDGYVNHIGNGNYWLTEDGYYKLSDGLYDIFKNSGRGLKKFPKVDTKRKFKLRLLHSVKTKSDWVSTSKLSYK